MDLRAFDGGFDHFAQSCSNWPENAEKCIFQQKPDLKQNWDSGGTEGAQHHVKYHDYQIRQVGERHLWPLVEGCGRWGRAWPPPCRATAHIFRTLQASCRSLPHTHTSSSLTYHPSVCATPTEWGHRGYSPRGANAGWVGSRSKAFAPRGEYLDSDATDKELATTGRDNSLFGLSNPYNNQHKYVLRALAEIMHTACCSTSRYGSEVSEQNSAASPLFHHLRRRVWVKAGFGEQAAKDFE
jgi:hypothetical protein